jgi:hypothetical protein
MIYLYECRGCGQQFNSPVRGDFAVDRDGHTVNCCAQPVKRRYQLAVQRPMHDHFNNTTNTVIGSQRQFKEELKTMSEAATLKTGIEHNFEPIDPEIARKAVEASDAQGLDSTNRVRVATGKRAIDI